MRTRTRHVTWTTSIGLSFVLWVACTVLHVEQLARGQLAWVGVYVTPPPDAGGLPTVSGFWPSAPASAAGTLRLGDRLARAGDADLHGVGRIGFAARIYAAAAERRDLHVPIVYERNGEVADTAIDLVPVAYPWRILPLTVTMVLTAVLVLWRRRRAPIARSFFFVAVAYALHWTFFFGGPGWQTWTWAIVFSGASLVMFPIILRGVAAFPPEIVRAGERVPRWPWLFALFAPISTSWVFGFPLAPEVGFRAVFAANVAFIVVLLALFTRNYRRAGPLGRRQVKWVVLGLYVGTVPVLLADVVATIDPVLWWLHEPAAIAEIVIPLSVLIAIVRSNLFDVDRLITGTAVYTILSILLLAALLFVVPHAASALSRNWRIHPSVVQPLLSVLVAAGAIPGHRVLQPRVERLVFRERHALRTGIDTLLRDLAVADGPEALFTLAGDHLDTLVRPRSCVIYAALETSFAPVYTRGADDAGPPPPVPRDGALIAALRATGTPLDVRRSAAPARTMLLALGVDVVVPVERGGELAAVICLGPKRSGDVYTPTDLALLGAVADKIAGELLRFDGAVILRQERAMNEALRRYVPEPVAVRLSRGESVEGGEQDVSVLFVDIRGYTTYSERRTADTVFSMVNRYIESVSAVIQRRGGTVVEFLGDGVMAVFGAPEPMLDHAREAVEAACEVVATVQRLALGARDGSAPISVGVGIASGEAFVGNVRTNDRLVYTAVGDVVNLASRIERLTRELGAAVAIDARTHETAGAPAARFECHQRMRIRGRSEPVGVFALPLAAA